MLTGMRDPRLNIVAVVLTGVEAVDPRWPSLPLLDVLTLKTVP